MSTEIHAIKLGLPISIASVNCYLLKSKDGDDYVLVDTGYSRHGSVELVKGMEGLGCRPGNLELIILTHGDLDHVVNSVDIRDKYQAPIAMHRGDSNMVETGKMLIEREFDSPLASLHVLFLFMPIILEAMIMLPQLLPQLRNFKKFKPDICVDEGFDLSPYGVNAKVLHLPGHTPGSIGILTSDGDLLCGDTFINVRNPDTYPGGNNLRDLHSSIKRLKTLDIKRVYPGHGKPFNMDMFVKEL
jgi:glyoxylase-like metal-dependent hydrolase (beta-lactamase superfamily II)